MPGMVDTPHEVYLFHGAEHIGEPTDAEEAGHVEWVALSDAIELAKRSKVAGSGSLVGLLYLLASHGQKRCLQLADTSALPGDLE
jgi:hypothetical protein